MKKLVEIAAAIKYTAGFAFTLLILGYTALNILLLGESAIPHSIVLQAIALAALLAIQQFVCFSEYLLKQAGGAKRVTLFAGKAYASFSLFALLFGWFPLSAANWLLFTVCFAAAVAAVVLAFGLYFKITGTRYNQLLGAYQSRNKA